MRIAAELLESRSAPRSQPSATPQAYWRPLTVRPSLSRDVLLGTDNGERHGSDEGTSVSDGSGIVILFERGSVDLDALSIDDSCGSEQSQSTVFAGNMQMAILTYPLALNLARSLGAECVGLCDNGDQVDTRLAELLHDFNVQGLQAVAGGADEVQAGVNTEVDLLSTARLLLLKHVRLVLVVKELDDGLP